MQKENIVLEECRSVLDLFSQTIEEKKNNIGHPLLEYPFKQEKNRWNSCLVLDIYFESGAVKIQQGHLVDLKDTEKHACRKLLKAYQVFVDGNEELIEPIEDIDDDVLTTNIEMAALIKNDRKRKINDTKDDSFTETVGLFLDQLLV